MQGLPLGGCRHLANACEVGKESFDILCPKKLRMGFAAKMMDVAEYPLAIGLLGAISIMMIAAVLRAPDP